MFLITDSKIEQVGDILPSLEIAAREGRPFVIIADEIEGQALAALIMNTIRGSMKVVAVKGPSYGEDRRGIMSDLATATGAKFFQQSLGHKVTEVSLLDFGQAKAVEISKATTTIVDGEGACDLVETRIDEIKNEINDTDDLHAAQRLQDRITRLSSGVAIIRVGASSEVELIEKKHRIEDALEAVNSAQEEGIVLGGGMTLVKISDALDIQFENDEQSVALPIIKKALQSPFDTMAVNAGHNPEVLRLTLGECGEMEGYNFLTSKKENLFVSGIIDPAKVTRCALKNAVSVAGTLLLTNHSVVHT